jgi:cytochrome c-type biogenesis protein CcmH
MTKIGLARVVAIILVLPLCKTAIAAPVRGQTAAEIDTEAGVIYRSVMSPFCPGRTLETCPSAGADALKDSIRVWLAEGQSQSAVMERLYQLYGDEVRAKPELNGFGIVGWVLPGALIVLGGVVIVVRLRRGRELQMDSAPGAASAAVDDTADERIRNEMAKLGL